MRSGAPGECEDEDDARQLKTAAIAILTSISIDVDST